MARVGNKVERRKEWVKLPCFQFCKAPPWRRIPRLLCSLAVQPGHLRKVLLGLFEQALLLGRVGLPVQGLVGQDELVAAGIIEAVDFQGLEE